MNKTIPGTDISTSLKLKDQKSAKKIIERPLVNVLWTGGYDSTLRMLQLSKQELDIQPYYLIDTRRSEPKELIAISEIRNDIEAHPETRCTVLPLKKFNVSDIEPDESISQAYQRLHANHLIGIQLDWLGRFSKLVPGIEIIVEKSLLGHTYNCIIQNGSVLKVYENHHAYYILDQRHSHPDLVKVFGNFHFPDLLFESTKLEMIDIYKNLGFEHVMNKTWFCHSPFRGKPCGICTPCKAVMLEGLSFRLTPEAIKRYHFKNKYGHKKWCQLLFRIQLKLVNLF